MKKVLFLILSSVLILALAGCGAKEPATSAADVGNTSENRQSQTTGDPQKPNEVTSGAKTLPASFPKETLPLAADAEIFDERKSSKPGSGGHVC